MKKNLFLLILIIFFGPVQSQTYHPFPTDSAFWKVVEQYTPFTWFITYELNGDTVVGAVEYAKVYESVEAMSNWTGEVLYLVTDSLIGGLREENKILYFNNGFSGIESVIY